MKKEWHPPILCGGGGYFWPTIRKTMAKGVPAAGTPAFKEKGKGGCYETGAASLPELRRGF